MRDSLGTDRGPISLSIAAWSTRRILWLWAAVIAGYGTFITVGAVKMQRERRAFEQAWDLSTAPVDSLQVRLTPAQVALRDSLVDSLRRIWHSYEDSPEGRGLAASLRAGLERALPSTGQLITITATFFAPFVAMLVLTLVWFRKRRALLRSAGA